MAVLSDPDRAPTPQKARIAAAVLLKRYDKGA